MRLRTRIITTMAVAFLLAPTLLLCADDTAKSAATAKKDGAVKSQGAPSAVVKANGGSTPGRSGHGQARPGIRKGISPSTSFSLATRISVS